MRKTVIIFLLQLFSVCTTQAQRLPFFTHYYNNPYLYNPAYAGHDKHTVFYLTHRQQWLGVEGAPMSSQLSFHSPMGNANPLFIGADIVDDRLGALKHNAIRFSLAYMIPLSSEHEHFLKTAFSSGIGMHSYDLAGMNIGDDQVLQAALTNHTFLDGRFGFLYHNRGFNLSVALPHLFTPPPVLVEGFSEVGFDQFSRMIFSTHYRFNFNEDGSTAFEPTILYHYAREDVSQLEALGIFYFKNIFWAGGGYQQQSGISGTAGVQVKNLKFSYAYSTGGSEISTYGMGTHEAQIGIVIGKKKEVLKRKPRLSTQNTIDDIPDEALLEKHAKSKKRRQKKENKTENLPDRKKVSPQPTVIESNSNEEETKPAEVSSSVQEKAEINTASTFSQITKAEAVKDDMNINNSSATQKNYDQLNFDSFDGNKAGKGVIQLGGNTSPEPHQDKMSSAPVNVEKEKTSSNKLQAEAQKETEERKITWDQSPWSEDKTDENAHPLAMKDGYYIIAGTFSTQNNAEKLANKLRAEGFFPEIGYHTQKQYYYVHVFQATEKSLALKELDRLKQNAAFQKSWILNIAP